VQSRYVRVMIDEGLAGLFGESGGWDCIQRAAPDSGGVGP
jgi:hypothetical protein